MSIMLRIPTIYVISIIFITFVAIFMVLTVAVSPILSTYLQTTQQEPISFITDDSYYWVVNTNIHSNDTITINKSYINQIIETNNTIKIIMKQYPKED